jgi:hypothetical protein
MSIIKFQINSKQSPYQVSAGSPVGLEFTIQFDSDTHPSALTIQYDIDDSGKSFGVTFDDGSTSIQLTASTTNRLNTTVANSFTLANGSNGACGINLQIVEDTSKTESIDVNYTNAHAATTVIKNFAEQGMMKDVKGMIDKAVTSGIAKHVKDAHSSK